MSLSNPFLQGSGIYAEEEAKGLSELEVMGDSKKQCLPDVTRLIYINSQRLWQHEQDLDY